MSLDANILAQVYGRHPARVLPFDELYDGLLREVAAGNVLCVDEGPLQLFLYSNRCIYDRNWNPFSLIARGLILEPASRRVVATPFPKFFNYGEVLSSVPDLPFEVTEKLDGSLVVVFHHDGRWRATTKGAFASEQAEWATRRLNESYSTAALEPGTTYLCEAVYRENRIVVRYDFEALVLLGAYDATGVELDRARLAGVAEASGLRLVAARHYDSAADLVAATQALGREAEGFVVRFSNGLRMKLKGTAYCHAHQVMSRCSPLAIWESVMAGADLDAMRRDLPEEMLADFDAIRGRLNALLENLVAEVMAAAERVKHLSDRDLGILLREKGGDFSDVARDFVFAYRKCDFRAAAAAKGKVRDGLLRRLRPHGNRLEGYTPSDVLNRFGRESQ